MTPLTSGSRTIGPTDDIVKLEWSSSNAASCESDGFSTGGNLSGTILSGDSSLIIAAGDTNVYKMRCKNSAGLWSSWRELTIIKDSLPPPPVNNPPNDPVIKGADMGTAAAISAPILTTVPFTFRATDPDLDQLYYVIDWNDDGLPDERLPSAGTVPSGTPLSSTFSWSTAGMYEINVRAYDDEGLASAWTSHSISITNPGEPIPTAPVISLTLDKYLVRTGEKVEASIEVTADYIVNCSLYGVAGSPVTINHLGGVDKITYNYPTNSLFATQVVEVICTPNVPGYSLPTEKREARVNVIPVIEER